MVKKKSTYEYSGKVWMKRKKNVINKLRSRRIKPSQIKSIKFNKRQTKGGWKFKATVVK